MRTVQLNRTEPATRALNAARTKDSTVARSPPRPAPSASLHVIRYAEAATGLHAGEAGPGHSASVVQLDGGDAVVPLDHAGKLPQSRTSASS
jgi:hypothetical protein